MYWNVALVLLIIHILYTFYKHRRTSNRKMQDASVNLEDMPFCKKLVHTFINDEVKRAYYQERG